MRARALAAVAVVAASIAGAVRAATTRDSERLRARDAPDTAELTDVGTAAPARPLLRTTPRPPTPDLDAASFERLTQRRVVARMGAAIAVDRARAHVPAHPSGALSVRVEHDRGPWIVLSK